MPAELTDAHNVVSNLLSDFPRPLHSQIACRGVACYARREMIRYRITWHLLFWFSINPRPPAPNIRRSGVTTCNGETIELELAQPALCS